MFYLQMRIVRESLPVCEAVSSSERGRRETGPRRRGGAGALGVSWYQLDSRCKLVYMRQSQR
jgi:hypothetical protein